MNADDLDFPDVSALASEADWLDSWGTRAQMMGWRVAHFRPARTAHGWRTAGTFDAAGFPDLVLVHPGRRRVLFRELKSCTGRLTRDQEDWLRVLRDAGADAAVWRPSERFGIEAFIDNERGAA